VRSEGAEALLPEGFDLSSDWPTWRAAVGWRVMAAAWAGAKKPVIKLQGQA